MTSIIYSGVGYEHFSCNMTQVFTLYVHDCIPPWQVLIPLVLVIPVGLQIIFVAVLPLKLKCLK